MCVRVSSLFVCGPGIVVSSDLVVCSSARLLIGSNSKHARAYQHDHRTMTGGGGAIMMMTMSKRAF